MSSGKSATVLAIALLLTTMSCVERRITVVSQPPGALCYVNGQEIGRTPVTHEFVYYGDFDIELRKDGYKTVKQSRWIVAPIWQWIPFDLVADVTPMRLRDQHYIGITMNPATTQPADPNAMLARAMNLRGKLESTENTRKPTTRPAASNSGAKPGAKSAKPTT